MQKKAKLRGRIIKSTKGKRQLLETMFKLKLSYRIEPSVRHDPKYQSKWESVIYKIIKSIFGINQNVKKEKLLNAMGINMEYDSDFIDRLIPNALKLKLGWLFNKFSKMKIWECNCIHSNNHWIIEFAKSEKWRIKWNSIWI